MLAVALLVAAVAVLLFGHHRIRPMLAVATAVAVGLGTGVLHLRESARAVGSLGAPLAFLVVAVPLAVLLDRLGFFDAVAERFAAGHRLLPTLWVLAAAVTTVFNLDASIVLLTPLYIRIARRHGLDPLTTAFMPVLLASLASSALPVSNLTNLIVDERVGAGLADFVVRLGPASVAATAIGWAGYRRLAARPRSATGDAPVVIDPHPGALRVGVPAVAVLLVGFTVSDALRIPVWVVAAVVAAGLAVVTRHLPWRNLPVEAVVVAAGLAVLAAAAAPHLGLHHWLRGTGVASGFRAAVTGVVGADAINNIPALLVGLPSTHGSTVWAYLAGVNFGPVLWVYGSLAGLLWIDIVRSNGLPMSPRRYAAVGVRVGLPAIALALPVAVVCARLAA